MKINGGWILQNHWLFWGVRCMHLVKKFHMLRNLLSPFWRRGKVQENYLQNHFFSPNSFAALLFGRQTFEFQTNFLVFELAPGRGQDLLKDISGASLDGVK